MNSFLKSVSAKSFDKLIVIPDSYMLVLVMFNCAILMSSLTSHNGLFFFPVFLLLFNVRLWVVSFIQIGAALILLLPVFARHNNHVNIEFTACIAIIIVFVIKLSNPRFTLSPSLTTHVFLTAALGIYFYSGFHKLNADFFNKNVSCSVELGTAIILKRLTPHGYDSLAAFVAGFPTALVTILLEMAVPFGLLWHRTRKVSLIILVLFHLFLVVYGFGNFSALALFILTGAVINFAETPTSRLLRALKIYMISTLVYATLFFFNKIQLIGFKSLPVVLGISTVIFGIGVSAFFVEILRENKRRTYSLQKRHLAILAGVVLLTSIWGLKNYVGLGNQGSFTMFSNLITEQSRSNHFLIDTRKTKIWKFEEDYVQLIALDIKSNWLKENSFPIDRTLIPVVEFSYLIRQWSDEAPGKIPCTLIYKGERMVIDDLKASRFSEYHWWYRFLPFRIIQLDGPNKCRW